MDHADVIAGYRRVAGLRRVSTTLRQVLTKTPRGKIRSLSSLKEMQNVAEIQLPAVRSDWRGVHRAWRARATTADHLTLLHSLGSA